MPSRNAFWILALLFFAGLVCPSQSLALDVDYGQTPAPSAAQDQTGPTSSSAGAGDAFQQLGSTLGSFLMWLLILCLATFLLFLLIVGLLLWKAKQLVANAVRSDPEALARLVAKLRRKHPDLDDHALCKKIILRQSNRAGLVGFVTGVGGLPTLPLALPIDIAATIRIQANMVHMIRLVHEVSEDEVPEAGLWLATTGGMELATAGSSALRKVVVKTISKSLLKFLPLIGGVIGFGLNWTSTQTMGRLGRHWMLSSNEKTANELPDGTQEEAPALDASSAPTQSPEINS